MTLPIVSIGEPVLRQAARSLTVEEILSPRIQELIAAMRDTMRAAHGVGLAAPQIGESLQLAVIEDRAELLGSVTPERLLETQRTAVPFRVLINPSYTVEEEGPEVFFEGCLSVPDGTTEPPGSFMALVPRALSVKVNALDENAAPVEFVARGWFARIVQHEIDHLRGTLYVDRMVSRSLSTTASWQAHWKARPYAEAWAHFGVNVKEKLPAPRPAWTPPVRTIGALLGEVRKFVIWHGRDHEQARSAIEAARRHPQCTNEALEAAVADGLEARALLAELDAAARSRGPTDAVTREIHHRLVARFPNLKPAAAKSLAFAEAARAREEARRRIVRQGGLASTVRPGGTSHRIQDLPAAPRWKLLVDETGSRFDEKEQGRLGRLVGLLVPEAVTLPALAGKAHAVDASDPCELDQRLQRVLDEPVGIFGVTLDALPPAPGDRWVAGVLEVVHWTLRLLTVDGPTEIDVVVEQRGEHQARSDWSALFAEVLRHLGESNPERYRHLTLRPRVIQKGDDPCNGYVDAIAHTWGSRAQDSRARLRQSGLVGSCLHDGDGTALREAWDVLRRGADVDGDAWSRLLSAPEAATAGSVPSLLLEQLEAACRSRPALWQRYFDAVRRHLDGKAVRLGVLGREVAWLAGCQPAGAALPAAMRLAWLTALLERDNHRGHVDEALAEELDRLGDELFEEQPSLVCQADLDRAVLATNRFDFSAAGAALRRWRDQIPAVPGLQHWGRVQSSLGQHAAFLGDHAAAERHFAEALGAFARLSDPDVGRGEIAQTSTYRAIAAMDFPGADPATVRARVSAVVSLSLEEIGRLAASVEPATKYRHHLLLRYLARHGTADERAAYLAARPAWSVDEGFPWPLILAYRALLVLSADRDGARELLRCAVASAFAPDQGPTVQLIGVAIGVAGEAIGAEGLVSDDLLDDLVERLPASRDRIEGLRLALAQRPDPLSILDAALPFNFR